MSRGTNLSDVERAVSAVLGLALLEHSLAPPMRRNRPLGRLMLGAFGLELVRRGISGYCFVSDLVGRPTHAGRASRRMALSRHTPDELSDPVDRDSADSFPASDPPGWTLILGP